MKKFMKKFRVATPLQAGRVVAAPTPELAVEALLSDQDFEVKREGRGWFLYEVEENLPYGWPCQGTMTAPDPEAHFGTVIDVEDAGEILIIEEDSDENTESKGDS